MFDYDLVGTKAVYRNYVPRDFANLLRLALRQAEEQKRKREPASTRDAVARTVAEFSRHKTKGAILLIEVEEDQVGYCILANRWSHERGGDLLCIEELYLIPEQAHRGIAEDLLRLLAEIAPGGSVAIQVEPPDSDRKAAAAWQRLGFHRAGNLVMIRNTRRQAE
jgi:GNAT superfamily N-acetyltransferase